MESPILIVGLGNPGPKYDNTRHNVGFMVLDELVTRFGTFGTRWQEKFRGEFAKLSIAGKQIILLKPQTYMNLSGRSVQPAMTFFKLSINDLIIIHDDIDLDYGMVRLKSGGGTGGHKGITSCKQELGDAGFHRIRIGVGRPTHGDVSDFVLKSFTSDEQIDLNSIIDRTCKAVECIADFGIVKAMNQFNQRQGDNQ
ncbi:MAG: aminoacyl-tRNA hydrolase [Deltaproteobacteria bacterium]|nr:aminoacyl-tRNA hydrolase [Deltaproteobacteria bacterium]MBN2673430.1 aminoacyl-tRNA hydrolase [Deltaproteobacteria bacterium]